jgi:hypothetical protein
MTADQKDDHGTTPEVMGVSARTFRITMLVIAIAMLGWTIPFSVANYKYDQCSRDLNLRLDRMNSGLEGMKKAN